MMTEIIEVKNLAYRGMKEYNVNGKIEQRPTMKLIDLTTEEWNNYAVRKNTEMYIKLTGMAPTTYKEVRQWVQSLIEGTKKPLQQQELN